MPLAEAFCQPPELPVLVVPPAEEGVGGVDGQRHPVCESGEAADVEVAELNINS